MLPCASFFAPCAVITIDVCLSSWQLAQIGFAASGLAAGCANDGAVMSPVNMARTPVMTRRARDRIWSLLPWVRGQDVWTVAAVAPTSLRQIAAAGAAARILCRNETVRRRAGATLFQRI